MCTLGLLLKGLFLVLHLNIALVYTPNSEKLRQARLAPKSRTKCTLGFVSSRAFLVLHLFIAVFIKTKHCVLTL